MILKSLTIRTALVAAREALDCAANCDRFAVEDLYNKINYDESKIISVNTETSKIIEMVAMISK
jgi:hypothetical protein